MLNSHFLKGNDGWNMIAKDIHYINRINAKFPDYESFKKYHGNINYDFSDIFKWYIKDTIHDEIADAIIRCLDLGVYLGEHIDDHMFSLRDSDFSGKKFSEKIFLSTGKLFLNDHSVTRLAGILANIQDFDISNTIRFHVYYKSLYNHRRSYKHGKAY